VRLGAVSLVLSFLGGLWLLAAPSLIGFARPGPHPWTAAVATVVVLGAVVASVSLATLVGLLGFTVEEREGHRRVEEKNA